MARPAGIKTLRASDQIVREYLRSCEQQGIPAVVQPPISESWLDRIGKGRTAWPIALALIALSLLLGWFRG